jgi:predicted transposase YbfD/YdcC
MPTPKNPFLQFEESFSDLPDPRIDRHKKYPLMEVLFLIFSGVLSNCDSWEEIADFGTAKLPWLRKYFPYTNGVPSHDTLSRVMGMINGRAFEKCFIDWTTGELVLPQGTVIQLDGKSLRRSVSITEQQTKKADGGKQAVHLLHAWCGQLKMCLAQYEVDGKTNEITAIPDLLDLLEISGCILTIDAMGCQKDIVQKIVDNHADYVIGLKGNQSKLADAVVTLFEDQEYEAEEDTHHEKEKGHGREEVRMIKVLDAKLLPDEITEEWAGLTKVVRIISERFVKVGEKFSLEARYYITSIDTSALKMSKFTRDHWLVENQLHYSLDVTFREDASRKRDKNQAKNFSIILKMAINALKPRPEKISIKRKRMRCGYYDDYRELALGFNA